MKAPPPREFPNAFDRIEFWAIGRQKVQGELWCLSCAPFQVKFGAMMLGVVADGEDSPAVHCTDLSKQFEELPERLPVEPPGLAPEQKLAVVQAHGGEVAHAFAGGVMIDNRIARFWRNPHPAAGALLLKVHFVQGPQVDTFVGHQVAKSFLCFFCRTGSALANTG